VSEETGKSENGQATQVNVPVKGNPSGLPIKGTLGGPRPGGGRKAGGKNASTKLREAALQEFRDRVAKKTNRLFNAQYSLSQGVQMLFRIDTDSKGNRSKPQLVTDQEEIETYLDEGNLPDGSSYYFLTTERPDNKAIESLLDRTYGKAQQNVKMEGDKENPLMTILAQYGLDKDINPPAPKEDTDTDA